jgi:hypothetical protein
MANPSLKTGNETRQQHFERVLSLEPFTGLKAIVDCLRPDRQALYQAVNEANSYAELLAKLGFQVAVVRQIHVQDAFSRVGPAGGIRAVIPYYDIPTQSSFPTLVNFDHTITSTPESVVFFNNLLAALKAQLSVYPDEPGAGRTCRV